MVSKLKNHYMGLQWTQIRDDKGVSELDDRSREIILSTEKREKDS